jgi:oligopeptide/dipeptide ABC transporter ATP-binding protein
MISRSPQLLIADEPTTALDVTIQAQILDLLMDLKNRNNMSLLIITHDFGIVADIADRVGVMYAGIMVEQGDVFDIFEKPRHPYTRLLMRALPRGKKSDGRLETIPGSVPSLVSLPTGCPFHPRCPERRPLCEQVEPDEAAVTERHKVRCHFWEG